MHVTGLARNRGPIKCGHHNNHCNEPILLLSFGNSVRIGDSVAKANSKFNFNLGYLYVAEMVGIDPPVYKVGKTDQEMHNRLRSASTFAPNGITAHRVQIFFDMGTAETNVHARLRQWHRPREVAGQATETFSASLDTIYDAIDEEVALQQEFARECDLQFDVLRTKGFLTENPDEILKELLQAKVAPKLTLKGAIVRCLNSTSFETGLCKQLIECGIEISRTTRTAKVVRMDLLKQLFPSSAKKRSLEETLTSLTHFDRLGVPVFSKNASCQFTAS